MLRGPSAAPAISDHRCASRADNTNVRATRPRLDSGDRVTVTDDVAVPGLGADGPEIVDPREGREPVLRQISRTTIALGVVGLGMLALTYVVLAATVMVFMRVEGNTVAVLRNTFPIGQAPSGAIVMVSSQATDDSLMGKAQQAALGVPAGSVVEIVAGPAAIIANDQEGRIVADGTVTEYRGTVVEQGLDRAYVAICITGACAPGDAVIVGQDNIVGEVKGYLGLTGISAPPSQRALTTPPGAPR